MASISKFPYRYRVGILLYYLILITYLDRVTISLVGVRIKGWGRCYGSELTHLRKSLFSIIPIAGF